MSDRSKKLVTLALNKELAKTFSTFRRKRLKNNDSDDADDSTKDPDFSVSEQKPKVSGRSQIKAKTNLSGPNESCHVCAQDVKDSSGFPLTFAEGKELAESRKVIILSDITLQTAESQKLNSEANPSIFVNQILQNILETVFDLACKNKITKKGTERKRKRYEMSLQQRKKQKRDLKACQHGVQSACSENCVQKCSKKINTQRREIINIEFWKLTDAQQKEFIFNAVKQIAKKRKTTENVDNSRRQKSLLYFLKDANGMDCRVCKKFFLGTLGYNVSNDRIVRDVLNVSSSEQLVFHAKKRGHPSEKKIDRDSIISHITSFNPTISHYRRAHAPNRKYLPSDINITLMHRDYLQKNPDKNISYELYRKQISEMNISFAALGNEECWQCEAFEAHSKISNHVKENIPPDCEKCDHWKKHYEHAMAARSEYQNDASKGGLFFSVDLEKVVMLPRCEMFKEIIFTPRIICFNESFVPIGKQTSTKKPIAAIWHEGIAGRNQFDIMSTFYNFFLLKRDAPEVTLWMDNCAAQNKNWNLYCFFVYLVNSSEIDCCSITLKYLETGHTFMSADSFHHQVEKSLKQKKKVLDFEDYVSCVKQSNNSRVEVIEMKISNFYDAKDHSSRFKLGKTTPKPYLSNFYEVQFKRGHNTLFYKTEFGGPVIELNFLTAQAQKHGVPKPTVRKEHRGVSKIRKRNLVSKLSEILPENRLKFWKELPESDLLQPDDSE